MLHPDLSLYRGDLFGLTSPVVTICSHDVARRRQALPQEGGCPLPFLFVHVSAVQDPVAAAAEAVPVRGTCFVFVSPFSKLPGSAKKDGPARHRVVAHSEDISGGALTHLTALAREEQSRASEAIRKVTADGVIDRLGCGGLTVGGDCELTRNRLDVVASCLAELIDSPVPLTSAPQVSAFLMLRCSLAPLAPSAVAELLDMCAFCGDRGTSSALLSYLVDAARDQNGFLGGQETLPLVAMPTGSSAGEWCLAITPSEKVGLAALSVERPLQHQLPSPAEGGLLSATEKALDIVILCLTSHRDIVSSAVHAVLHSSRKRSDRVAAVGPGGGYLLRPMEVYGADLRSLAFSSSMSFDGLEKPADSESCWLMISRTFTQWRRIDDAADASAKRWGVACELARRRRRVIVLLGDEGVASESSATTFSSLRFVDKNPLFYGASCHSIVFGNPGVGRQPGIFYKELYTLSSKMEGIFVGIGTSEGATPVRSVVREVVSALEFESRKVLSHVYFAVVPTLTNDSEMGDVTYSSGTPCVLDLPRIRGRLVKASCVLAGRGAAVAGAEFHTGLSATCISTRLSINGAATVVAWAYAPAAGGFVISHVSLSQLGGPLSQRLRVQASPQRHHLGFPERDLLHESHVEILLKWVRCCDVLRDSVSLAWMTTPLDASSVLREYLRVCETASPKWVVAAARSILSGAPDNESLLERHAMAKDLLTLLHRVCLTPFDCFSNVGSFEPSINEGLSRAATSSRGLEADSNAHVAVVRSVEASSSAGIRRISPVLAGGLGGHRIDSSDDDGDDVVSPLPPNHSRIVPNSSLEISSSPHPMGVPLHRRGDLQDDDEVESSGEGFEEALEIRAVSAVDPQLRDSAVFVDERWLALGRTISSASSFEAALTRSQPSGIVTQKSFSVVISKFSHGVVYVSLPLCEALTNIGRSRHVNVTRKLFLCEIHDGDVVVKQKETVHQGPTWGGDGAGSSFGGTAMVSSEHAFYNLERGKSYCVIHLAAVVPEGEWLRTSDFIVADGVEFTTPVSYVQDVTIDEVSPRSLSLQWDGNCNGYMVTYQNLSCNTVADAGLVAGDALTPQCASFGEGAPTILCTAGQSVQLNNLMPASIYLIRVSPNGGQHNEGVDTEEVIAATPPELSRDMIDSNAFIDRSDPFRVYVRVGLILPSYLSCNVGSSRMAPASIAAGNVGSAPVIIRGGGFELCCTPMISVNHSHSSEISLRAGSPVLVQVGFEMVVVKRSNNFQVFSKRINDVISSRLGPFHVITNLRIAQITDCTAIVSWYTSNSSGATRLQISQSSPEGTSANGTMAPSPSSLESASQSVLSFVTPPDGVAKTKAELESECAGHRQLISVEAGQSEHRISDLKPDCTYNVVVSCEGNVADQVTGFRTAPPPPRSNEVVIQHNAKLQAIYISFPSAQQLRGRLLRATVLPTRAIYNSAFDDARTAVADVAVAENRGEAVAIQLIQYSPGAAGLGDGQEHLESEPTYLFAVTNVRLMASSSSYEIRFTCGMKASTLSVGIGSQFVVAEDGNSRAVFNTGMLLAARGVSAQMPRLPPNPQQVNSLYGATQMSAASSSLAPSNPLMGLIQPVIFSGVDLLEEQTTMFCVLPPPSPSERLFTTKIFDDHAVISMVPSIIDGFMRDVNPSELWESGLVMVSLVFASPCMQEVEVPLPLPPLPPVETPVEGPSAKSPLNHVHTVVVPLSLQRSLTATISCYFQIVCASDEKHYFLNSSSTVSPPILLATPAVFDITSITASDVTCHGAVLQWDSKNDLFDITVMSQGIVTFTTKTTRSKIGLEGLLPGMVYHVVITGNMSGAHEGHFSFVTPIDLATLSLTEFCQSIRLSDDGVVHAVIPPTSYDSCTGNPNIEGGGVRATQMTMQVIESSEDRNSADSLILAAPARREWTSQDEPLSAAISLFDPKLLQRQIISQQQHGAFGTGSSSQDSLQSAHIASISNPRLPHLSIHAAASLREAGIQSLVTVSASRRIDIIGCPRVVFSDDHQFLTLYWVGSASHYTVSIQGSGTTSCAGHERKGGDLGNLRITGGTVTKAAPSLLLRCADYCGQVLRITIESLDCASNSLSFTVVVPDLTPTLRILKHTIEYISVELPAPKLILREELVSEEAVVSVKTHTVERPTGVPILVVSTSFEFEGAEYSYQGDGQRSMICNIAVRNPIVASHSSDATNGGVHTAPRAPLGGRVLAPLEGQPTMALHVKTRTEVAGLDNTSRRETKGDCLNPSIEVSSTQVLPVLRPLGGAKVVNVSQTSAEIVWNSSDDEFYCTVKSFKTVFEGESSFVERSIVLSVSNLKLKSLVPGSYHEVGIRGRRSGDTNLHVAFFTCPAFGDNSVSFRRHHNGLKYTVLMDDILSGNVACRCGNRMVDVKVELLVCEADGTIQEAYPIGREPLNLEFINDMTTLFIRKALRGTRVTGNAAAESSSVVVINGARGPVIAADENAVDSYGIPDEITIESRLFVCRAPRYLQLAAMSMVGVGPNYVTLQWPEVDPESSGHKLVYTATIEAVETLSHVANEQLRKHVAVVSEAEVTINTLNDSTLYRAHIRVDTNFALYTVKHPALIIHDEAPEVPSVCRYFITPSKKMMNPLHKRFVGGATFYLDALSSLRRSSLTGLRSFAAVRLLPDNAIYVHSQPTSNGGVPVPTSSAALATTRPTFLVIPASTAIDNNKYAVDVPLNEPATELTHRFEFFNVLEVSREYAHYGDVLNPIQYNEPDVQLIQLVRALSKPQCVMSSSTRAELRWVVSNAASGREGLRYDVIVENMLAQSRQEVQRVVEERVLLEQLSPAMAYRVSIAASVKDIPCEPLSVVLLTAPRKPKPPRLSTSLLSVVFDVPPSTITPASDGFNITVSMTAVVICEKEQSIKGCTTAMDFMERAQSRNIFRSTPNAAQRIDLRLRSSKAYRFIFFSSIHHPEAINGVVHSKPAIVDFNTDCFPPQSLHLISRTKGSVTVGWTTPDFGSKAIIFEVQMSPIGPIRDPSTLATLQRAVALAGGLPSGGEMLENDDINARLIRDLGSQNSRLAIDVFSDKLNIVETKRVESSSGHPSLHCTFSQISPAILYAFRVRQLVGELASSWSNTLVTGPLAPPTAVTNLRVTNLTSSSMMLSWVSSQIPQEGETMSYLVQLRAVLPTVSNSVSNTMHTAGGGGLGNSPPKRSSATLGKSGAGFDREEVSYGTSAELKNLVPNTQYRIVVTPINHYGERCVEKNATLLVRTEAPSTWRS